MSRLIKSKFKYISKKMLAIFVIIAVVIGYVVWQIGSLTFNAESEKFVDVANGNHWGRSTVRAYLNPSLVDSDIKKTYAINSADTDSKEFISYESNFRDAELEIVKSGIGYTVETKNSGTNIMEKTIDKFWLPSSDGTNVYWGKEDISDENTKAFVNNDNSKKGYFIPKEYQNESAECISRSNAGNQDIIAYNSSSSNLDIETDGEIAPIFTIDKNSFSWASVVDSESIINEGGFVDWYTYFTEDIHEMHLKKYTEKVESDFSIKSIEISDDNIKVNFDKWKTNYHGSYNVVVCAYNDNRLYLHSENLSGTSGVKYLENKGHISEDYNIVAWVENQILGETAEVGEIFTSMSEFNLDPGVFIGSNELYTSWKLDSDTDGKYSGSKMKIVLGTKKDNLLKFWICGRVNPDGTLNNQSGQYLVLYQASGGELKSYNGNYSDIGDGRNIYNKKEKKYSPSDGGKGVIPTLTNGLDEKACTIEYRAYNDQLTYEPNDSEIPDSYTWYYYKINFNDSNWNTDAYQWTEGFPTEPGYYNVKACANATANNAAVESDVVSIQVIPQLNSITPIDIKETYVVGQKFDFTTGHIQLVYSDGTTKIVNLSDENVTINIGESTIDDGYVFNNSGSVDVKFTYTQTTNAGEKYPVTASDKVTVEERKLQSITATAPGELSFLEGKEIGDMNEIIVQAYYNDSPETPVTIYENGKKTEAATGTIEFSPSVFNLTGGAKQSLTVKYNEGDVEAFDILPVTVEQKLLESIEVISDPTKKIYISGEKFDSAGMVVQATYNNGDKRILGTDEYSSPEEPFTLVEPNEPQTNVTVTVTYKGGDYIGAQAPTASVSGITVNPPRVTGINVTYTGSEGTTYISGQSFPTSDIKVEAVYDNDSTKTLLPAAGTEGQECYDYPEYVVNGIKDYVISYTTVNPVNKKEETFIATMKLDVIARDFSNIYVNESSNYRTNYVLGESFDPTGLIITATLTQPLAGKSEVDIHYFDEKYWSFEPEVFTEATDNTTVKVTYKPKGSDGVSPTTTIEGIIIEKNELTSITTKNLPQTNYAEGTSFNPTGLVITANYKYGDSKNVAYDEADNSNFSFEPNLGIPLFVADDSATSREVTIKYQESEESSASTDITVYRVPKMLSGMEVTTLPNNTEYIEGQEFDPIGLEVKVNYTDNASKILTVKQEFDEEGKQIPLVLPEGLTYSPAGKLTTEDKKITVEYTEGNLTVKADIDIEVSDRTLNNIEVTAQPNKLVYVEGETFDPTGMVVEGTFNDNSKEILKCKNEVSEEDAEIGYRFLPNGNLTAGKQEIDISPTKGDASHRTVNITVNPKRPSEIAVVKEPTKDYIEEQTFDPTNLVLTVKYDNGETKDIEVKDATNLPEGLTIEKVVLTKGENKIKIKYQETVEDLTEENPITVEVETSLTVNAREKQAVKIEVATDENFQSTYVVGEAFNTTGLTVTAIYDNDTFEVLSERTDSNLNGYYYFNEALAYGITKFHIYYDTPKDTIFATVDVNVAHRSFSKIEVKEYPEENKQYVEGQSFNPDGLVITATLNSPIEDEKGNKIEAVDIKTFSEDFWSFEPDPLITDTKEVTVRYRQGQAGLTTSIDGIKVEPKQLNSISVKNQPTNIRYAGGAKFNPEGLIVTANYNDGKSVDVQYIKGESGSTASHFKFTPEELNFKNNKGDDTTSQEVKITYTDEYGTAYTLITVYKVPKVPTKLEVLETSGNKTTYTEGEEFDPIGLRLKVTYTDGDEKEIVVASLNDLKIYNISYNPTGKLLAGSEEGAYASKVTIEYTEPERTADGQTVGELTVKTTQSIVVKPRTLDRIEVTTLPKVSYIEGETFDPTGMVVTKYYDNGTSETTTDYNVTYGEDGTPVGELSLEDGRATRKTIKVTLNDETEKTATFDIWIAVKIPTDIEINHDPKTNYVVGQSFDPTGLKFTVMYNNGIEEIIEVTNKDNLVPGLSFIVEDPLTFGTKNVTIRFEKNGARIEKTLTINVEGKKLDYIYVAQRPEKILYIDGEIFDPTGMLVKAHYNDGEEIELKESEYTYNAETLRWNGVAEQDITVTYRADTSKTAHQTVTVIQKTITGLSIEKKPNKTSYFVGESFDPTGMKINAIFNNGESKTIYGEGAEDIGGEMIIAPSYLAYGDTRVMISYIYNSIAVITEQSVTVDVRSLESINVVALPTNLEYVEGESFDPEGMVVMAKYNNGFEEQLNNNVLTISPNPLTIDTKEVQIYYTSKNITKMTTQEVTVRSIDDVYKQATLQDELKQALITGKFTEGAELVITRIEDDKELYTELYERLTKQADVALLYDVSIVGGEYHGKLRLTFVVGEDLNGKYVTIIHKLKNGEKELLSGIVRDGRVTVTVNELSPFMLALDAESKDDNNGDGSGTGDNTKGGGSDSGSDAGGAGSGSNTGSTSGDSNGGSNVVTGSNLLNTGDSSLSTIFSLIAILSTCVVVILVLRKIKLN